MSNYLAIATVTATLTEVLRPAVESDVPGAVISVGRPKSPAGGDSTESASVNIYLYQATPNSGWRNMDLPTRDSGGAQVQRPVAGLDLHYLFTFYGNETYLEPERLLGSSTRALHSRPVLDRESIVATIREPGYDYLANADLADSIELVKFSPIPFSLEELSKLWSVFLQTSYTLSVAYKGTVVLIEAATPSVCALPTGRQSFSVTPVQQPVVDRVSNIDGALRPITADSTLLIEGQNLAGDVTSIRLGGETIELPQTPREGEPPPPPPRQRRLEVRLSWLSPGTLQAGPQVVQVLHDTLTGEPPKRQRATESRAVPFAVRPILVSAQASREALGDTSMVEVSVEVRPAVGTRQVAALLLNKRGATASAASYNLPAEVDPVNPSILVARSPRVAAGTYLVRVQVDGVASELTVAATSGLYDGPEVIVP